MLISISWVVALIMWFYYSRKKDGYKQARACLIIAAALLVLNVFIYAIAENRSTPINEPRAVEPSSTTAPIITKEQYLESVRQNSPDNTVHIVCLYSKYIDRHGVEGAIKMDEEIAKSPDAQAKYDKELDSIAKKCPN